MIHKLFEPIAEYLFSNDKVGKSKVIAAHMMPPFEGEENENKDREISERD